MPDRTWDFTALELELTIDLDEQAIEGRATHWMRPLGAATEVTLHAVDLEILGVKVDGAAVEGWRSTGDRLVIPVSIRPDERAVEVRYRAHPKAGMYFRGPPGDAVREVWTQGEDEENRHWYPGWDYPNDRFTVRVAATVPEDLTVVANGVLVGKAPGAKPGTTRWEYWLDTPVVNYLVALAAGDYRVVSTEGTPDLEQVVARWVDDDTLARTTAQTGGILDFLGRLLGTPYPWSVYRQVFVQRFLYGGMENATTTILADGYLLDDPTLDRHGVDSVLAHEAAHQWFGDLIGIYGWRELWLNEGFATYYSNRWHEDHEGAGQAAPEVLGWMTNGHRESAPMAPRGWSKVAERRNAQVYQRGAAVLHALEVALGRPAFDAAMKAYVADNAGGLVETDDFRRAVEDATGAHLGWLFDRWVHSADFAEIDAEWAWSDGALRVTVNQRDGGAVAAPVWVEIGGVPPRRARLWLTSAEASLVVPLDSAPAYVAVDPDRGILATWKVEQPPAAWVAQLGSPTPLARLTAIEALKGGKATPEAVKALDALANSGGEPPAIRIAALGALGELGEVEGLLATLGDPDPRVRGAAVDALGQVPSNPDRAQAARAALRDESREVRERALRTLEKLDPALALAEARRQAGGRSTRGSPHATALGVLGRIGVARDLDALVAHIDARETRDARYAAARGAADLAEREEAETKELSRRLTAMLDDPDRLDGGLAVALLGRVGSDLDVAALRGFAAHQSLARPDLAGAAHEAIAAIAGRAKVEPKTAEDLAELERIRASLADLEERIKELETWR